MIKFDGYFKVLRGNSAGCILYQYFNKTRQLCCSVVCFAVSTTQPKQETEKGGRVWAAVKKCILVNGLF